MLTMQELTSRLSPERVCLLLGAGSAVSSGAPTGAGLAEYLARQLNPVPVTRDLARVCGIWEIRKDRRSLVDSVRQRLAPLRPSNGLLSLPHFAWRHIYTTNFDELLERAYSSVREPLTVVRSNFEWVADTPGVTTLFKIHGCVTQDISLGNTARMVLTERDYDAVADYRQTLLTSLRFDLLSADVLVIGQSLQDHHLRADAKEVASLRATAGATGQVYVLAFEHDLDEASLLEASGLTVTFGSLEDLMVKLSEKAPQHPSSRGPGSPIGGLLPTHVAPTCIDVAHALTLAPNAGRLFNGGAASYADVQAGYTARRSAESRLVKAPNSTRGFLTSVIGPAGVGKTTVARRVLSDFAQQGFACWEAVPEYDLDVDGWLVVEGNLRAAGRQGFLFIDDCTRKMPHVNRLATRLCQVDRPFLRLILTSTSAEWKMRQKSPFFFSRGNLVQLGKLTEFDLAEMVNLVEQVPQITNLADADFLRLGRNRKLARLRDRCKSEMFVCLKNIFGSNELDFILLNEFSALGDAEQDVYRHVAVLQAMNAEVHRQLIMRVMGLDYESLKPLLLSLDGVVEEYTVNASLGLYGWTTRHDVIAETIAKYKFDEPQELFQVLETLISGLNPTVGMELATMHAMCSSDWGISHLPSEEDQVALLNRLIDVVPGERTPRRRLVRRHLESRELGEAYQAIQAARRVIGQDNIINRYDALRLLYRAEEDSLLQQGDRLALLKQAAGMAEAVLVRDPLDVHTMRVFGNIAVKIATLSGQAQRLEDAVNRLRAAQQQLLDPEVGKLARHFDQVLSGLAVDIDPGLLASPSLAAELTLDRDADD
jgi:SIR2-like domain